MSNLPPGWIMILGACFIPFVPEKWRKGWMLALPSLSLLHLLSLDLGASASLSFFDMQLEYLRFDKLSRIFGIIFHIAAILNVIYSWHVKDRLQHMMGIAYAGAAIGAALAGDLVMLFIYWELTAITSVFLIWATKTEASYRSGMRYLIIQISSGVLLLAGTVIHVKSGGSLKFDHLGVGTLGTNLIFVAFGIKCAFPLLHNWLQDAYPNATPTGTVVLSAFTTKLAIYALARGYAGTEILIPIGAVMTAFPIFYAVLENDLRKVLAYSLNNQLGFMVVGIGIGTELALNGTAAHAFAHILYKALLFMAVGAVIHRVGSGLCTDLGGLYKCMPWTTTWCLIGAASISAFPLFSGFVTKSMIMTAAAKEGYTVTWFMLLFASAGVLHHSGIKVPFFTFFHHDKGHKVAEAPKNMLWAMGIASALCVGIGVFPSVLYKLLPFTSTYVAYDVTHVVTQLQLLVLAMLAFSVLFRWKIEPEEVRCTNLDFDWTYRKLIPSLGRRADRLGGLVWSAAIGRIKAVGRSIERVVRASVGPSSRFTSGSPTSQMVFWVLALLVCFLVTYYNTAA